MTPASQAGAAAPCGGFPDEEWADDLREKYAHVRLANGCVDVLGTPIPLDPPEAGENECAVVLALADLRTVERGGEIRTQAESRLNIIYAFIDEIDPRLPAAQRYHIEDIGEYALKLAEDLCYRFKAHYKRARPIHCCGPKLRPLYPPGSGFADHPSYPSGHSTQAHTLAYILATCRPEWKETLLEVAARVALNRELAGVHFPSDSEAGKLLGKAVAKAIVDPPQAHRDAEWQTKFQAKFDELQRW